MVMPLDSAREMVRLLNAGRQRNLAAQTHAKHVLREVRETSENFPNFDGLLDEKITLNAYAMLAAGCSLIEQQVSDEGAAALEQAATWLHEVHSHQLQSQPGSRFHQLVAAMAFYAAGHYSRAFVGMRNVEQTVAAGLVAAFIRKDTQSLIPLLNEVLLAEPPQFDSQHELSEWVITISIAQSLAWIREFQVSGETGALDAADSILADALILGADTSPSGWWVLRLLRLMLRDIGGASLWAVLPPYFGGDNALLNRYIRLMAFAASPVVELWKSQTAALPVALDLTQRGAVINLRTSAGKTRVAELAILQTFRNNPDATVVYLAPFRSLAFEIEHSLAATFSPLGYTVSHLYGGQRVSAVDLLMASESRITIATPEKARALWRSSPELFERVKLFIIDEGHLIGTDERDIRNEAFVDYIRQRATTLGARIVLLSAVLPNTEELAEWISGNREAVARSSWKPSAERYGVLRWNGQRVGLEWRGEVPSFNPSFIQARPKTSRANSAMFPAKLNEAVAATAVRLSEIGPVMIFTARAVMVPGYAKAAMLSLGAQTEPYPWPEREWNVFQEVCNEELLSPAIELAAARYGIICHSNRLPAQVRMATEQLMRAYPPRIIVATKTLGQGVNVGVSSVIVANTLIAKGIHLEKRDFWNICGRAGRAFVDNEGKILVAVANIPGSPPRAAAYAESRATAYFDQTAPDRVESGILQILNYLWQLAQAAAVSFDVLVERIANDDRDAWGDHAGNVESALDLLDDTLLAMHLDARPGDTDASPDLSWIETVFRGSLATIQARAGVDSVGEAGVLRLIRARAATVLRRVPALADRNAVVASGLPVSVAQRLRADMATFREWVQALLDAGWSPESLNEFVANVEMWARLHAQSIVSDLPAQETLDCVRPLWLGGIGLKQISLAEVKASKLCRETYGFQLPWLLNAIAQQFDPLWDDAQRSLVSDVAMAVELGLPSTIAARIFVAGVKSRASSTELAAWPMGYSQSVSQLTEQLRDKQFSLEWLPLLSEATQRWLSLLNGQRTFVRRDAVSFVPFSLRMPGWASPILQVRSAGGQQFLCSPDGKEKLPVTDRDGMPFSAVADDPTYAFVQNEDIWRLVVRDPRITTAM